MVFGDGKELPVPSTLLQRKLLAATVVKDLDPTCRSASCQLSTAVALFPPAAAAVALSVQAASCCVLACSHD
uniref:Uncharacterized protein n=1 Tax=Oryza barthii TaxID=65489 RepID=A0A0D3F366_9ORYZ